MIPRRVPQDYRYLVKKKAMIKYVWRNATAKLNNILYYRNLKAYVFPMCILIFQDDDI